MPQLDLIMIYNQSFLFPFFVLGYILYIQIWYPSLIFILKYKALIKISTLKESECLEDEIPFLKKMIKISVYYIHAVDILIKNYFFFRVLTQQKTPFLIDDFFVNLDFSSATRANGFTFVRK